METIPGLREGRPQGDGAASGFWSLVLAAGAGSRFGGDKLRALWGGGTLIDAALAAARAAPVDGVVLVTRPGDRLLSDRVIDARLIGDLAIRVVEAADWRDGMGASLRAGAAAVPEDAAGVYVFLGDMPRIPHTVLALLAEAVRAGAPAAAPTFDGRDGHPVLFSAALLPALRTLGGDRGARRLLDGLGGRLARIPAPDDGVLFDVDTRDQLDAASGAPPKNAG